MCKPKNNLSYVGGEFLYKVGMCGHFARSKNLSNGQTIKTKQLHEELSLVIGRESVYIVDTHQWRRNPAKLLVNSVKLLIQCENVIILPAHNGIKVFALLFSLLNKFFKRKLHYVVIGGWLPKLLEENATLKRHLYNFDGIYVETNVMINGLKKMGFKNIRYLPNFKRLEILLYEELEYTTSEPYKLCTFSRVIKEKGIENAIKTVHKINRRQNRTAYTLDIYGQIEDNYKKEFQKLIESSPEYVRYKGLIDYSESTSVLRKYFALLFPTQFKTEGIPGTIIDAYTAGLPVIASKWESSEEIIDQYSTGIIYDFDNENGLEESLMKVLANPKMINQMKVNCLKKAEKYTPEVAISEFIKYL